MAVFGPFPTDRPEFPIGIAVSGGADSLCLAWLMRRWRRAVFAFVVDHGLRRDSAIEAKETALRLTEMDIPVEVLRLDDLDGARRVQANARDARYRSLAKACAARGILDLALGHHQRDQIETFLIRQNHGSTSHGLAGMALSRETPALRYLRPLLRIPPDRLRATLRAASLGWVEDPSNRNPAFERVRIRRSLTTVSSATSLQEIGVYAGRRNQAQFSAAALAVGIRMDRLGFAVMETLPQDVALMGRLWQIVSGATYPPAPHILAALIARPEPVTLGGAMLCRAGKLGPGWLLLREPAAVRSRIPADEGTLWDNRFRASGPPPGPGLTIAALGTASRDFRSSGLPSRVLASLPALWRGEHLADVPSLEAAACPGEGGFRVTFLPSLSLTEASFWPEYAQ